ncbi:hypothetical protein ACFQ0T_23580 [Kitasatospora gansuensis]
MRGGRRQPRIESGPAAPAPAAPVGEPAVTADLVAELLELAGELPDTLEPSTDQGTVLRFPHPIPLVGASDTERGRELMAHRRRRGKNRPAVPRPRPLGELGTRRRPEKTGEDQN